MRGRVSTMLRGFSVVALLAAAFVAGLKFANLRERVLYEFPIGASTVAGMAIAGRSSAKNPSWSWRIRDKAPHLANI